MTAGFDPLAREVGGDFYDFIPMSSGRLALDIGDVTDKGVPAAIVMATTRSTHRPGPTHHSAQRSLWDIAFLLGAGRTEDRMWQHTLRSLADHFGVTAEPETTVVKVDRKRLWRNARHIIKNAAIGSLLHLPSAVSRRRGSAA